MEVSKEILEKTKARFLESTRSFIKISKFSRRFSLVSTIVCLIVIGFLFFLFFLRVLVFKEPLTFWYVTFYLVLLLINTASCVRSASEFLVNRRLTKKLKYVCDFVLREQVFDLDCYIYAVSSVKDAFSGLKKPSDKTLSLMAKYN